MNLLSMALGRITNRSRKEKRVIKRWRLDRFANEEIYQEALKAEVDSFSVSIKNMVQKGMKGHELVLHE